MSDGLKLLSAGAVKNGVTRIAKEFERATGAPVTIEFNTAPELRKRIAAGDSADVIVAPPAAMDEFQKAGRILGETRGFIGRSRVGVVVPSSAGTPDVSTTAAFRKTLAAATSVVYNNASSGLYCAKLMEKLGLDKEIGAKVAVVDSGAAIMRSVEERGPGAVGLAQISEIMVMIDKGCAVKLVAPLPDEIQNETSYEAAAVSSSYSPDAARKLAASLSSDSAKKVFAATGIF
jgi:molybdate transport system substrate-binding protein